MKMKHPLLKSLALSGIFALSGGCAFLTSAVPEESQYCKKIDDTNYKIVNTTDQNKPVLHINGNPTGDKNIIRANTLSTFDDSIIGGVDVNLAEKTCTTWNRPEYALFSIKKSYKLK